jgi:hemin uptake protein HemP
MKPPIVEELTIPSSHKTTRITRIVESIPTSSNHQRTRGVGDLTCRTSMPHDARRLDAASLFRLAHPIGMRPDGREAVV